MNLSRLLPLAAGLVALTAALPAPANAAFAGNNGRIVFSRAVTRGNTEIFVSARDGSGVAQLTQSPGADDDPVWSPDGKRIAFSSDRAGNADIYVMNADGSGVIQLTTDPGADTDPAWSSDGTQIAFVSDRTGGDDIWAMGSDGSLQRDLTNTPVQTTGALTQTNPDGTVSVLFPPIRYGNEYNPAWSPNGATIAFASDRTRNLDLYTMNADGTNQQPLRPAAGQDAQPSWSPDGTKIAYRTTGFAGDGIQIITLGGALVKSLIDPFATDSDPAFSPDGNSVVFRGLFRPGGNGLYRMPTDGSGLLKLTGDGSDQAPDWQPCATCTPDVTVTPPPPPPADVNPTKPGAFGPGKQATKPGGSGGSGGSGGKSDGPTNSAGGGGAKATTMTARVVKVLSANLVRLTQVKPRKVFELHLIGIDVPKSGQCGGTQSRAALRKLLIARNGVGRLVRVSTDAHVAALDSHRRVNGYMTLLTTGRPVALAQITAGWAKAKGGRYTMAKRFRTAQASAKKARRGVWRRCGGSFHARVR